MRLTLRTLLAYLDDVLEPAQTKLIGQKVKESPVAEKLVNLIKLVMRQRRLKSPTVSGPEMGIDPNVVAEYLDNKLPPEKVVEVERVLLNSDELLAETASCHQVLAMLLDKTAEVPLQSRERLYALGPVAGTDRLQAPDSPPTESASPSVAAALERDAKRTAESSQPQPVPAHEIPDYLRPNPWAKRLVPASVIALLIVVCGALLMFDPGFLTGLRKAKDELSMTERNGDKNGTPAAGNNEGGSASTEGNSSDSTNTQVAATTPNPAAIVLTPPHLTGKLQDGIDPTPPPDAPEARRPTRDSSIPPSPVDAAAVNLPADATVAANSPQTNVAPGTPVTPAPVTVSALPIGQQSIAVHYTSNDGIVLKLDSVQQHWFMLPRRSVVAPNEWLAMLEPFEALLDFDHGAILATVLGDSSIRVLGPNHVASAGLELRRGRILLRSGRKDPQKTLSLAIAVGADLWKLELLSSDTICAIEISQREPVQFEKPLGPNWYQGALRVLSGSVNWSSAGGKPQTLKVNTALEIVSEQPEPATKPVPITSTFAPEWTDSLKRKQFPMRRFASVFEKQFELDQPVEQMLLALVTDSNAKVAELAVRGLGVTESADGLVQALAECNFEEGRFAARDGLRLWLAGHADRGATLKAMLQTHYPTAESNAVYLLLWGFRPEDARNRATSLEIVSFLRSNHVEIRELAYYWVVQLSGRKWEFRATDVPIRREAGVRRIEAHIEKDGALVKPEKTE